MVAPSKNTVAGKRVAIYARRSDVSGDRDRSIEEQVAECERWARERGYAVVDRVRELRGSGDFLPRQGRGERRPGDPAPREGDRGADRRVHEPGS